ncbi:immunity protein TriTu family protein [Streptomyces mirabilis]|uniref:immunity protein TriTu family protein n=1 Tax=Streptomyces mirabilis TaxID=68239 RepID=UPI0031BB6EC1
MNEPLPDVLKARVDEARPRLEESGFTLEVIASPERTEKKSFGVYMEREGRGVYLTVWDSGEVQVSAIDYDVDTYPSEKYLSDAHADRLGAEFEKLVDWLSGSSGQS